MNVQPDPRNGARERGVALITVILIVALAASMAAFMAWQQQIWVRQVENLRDQAQAQAVARAAIDWARAVLADDARNNNVDHLGEKWASVLAPLPVENGQVTGSVADQQGLFNLNNLVRNGKASQTDLAIFQRLLELLALPVNLANAVVDWIDADSETTYPGGAEDFDYLAMDPSYRAANRMMVEVGNLYRVKGFAPEMVERLRPFVTALPEPTPVNVNTAPAEVLAALFQDMSLGDAKALVEARKSSYFQDQADFRAHLPATKVTQIRDNDFSVNSRYFMVTSLANFGRAQSGYKALLARQGEKWPVVVWKKTN
ncbi:general secretion pathway protein K [Sulfuricella denitrificans skB26]|uniref:Type II secretion system protein K n=1 Tax=Sulfuricella denitrificans (strain DSM 22764 / NBRC 105220 / skB26) TaxID=1163617 RepID=S6AKM7_SULDS|nr:type II secretion system minor pseudopilin GspK [Sulfuricella denitrificans]BAN35149.1 general secretion pathway protein K [Sulfuricella denitrificans skB26]